MRVRKAFIPLHLVSKVLCICPFSLNKLKPSRVGSLITIFQAICYTIFHLWMVNRDMSAESTKNLVGIIIDSYNRYSGFWAFCVLVIASIAMQQKVVQLIRQLEIVDLIFQQKFNIVVDNRVWRR